MRWAVSLALVAVLARPATAAASTLGVSAETLTAHLITVSHCDLTVTSAITSVGGLGLEVDTVELTDLDVTCDGLDFKVALVRADGSMLGAEAAGTFSLVACGATCTASVSFAAQVLPFADADHAALDIHG